MIDLKQAAPDLNRSVCVYLPNSVLINHLHASWQSRGDISLCQAARNTSSNHLALPACRLGPASCTAGDLPNSVLSSCVGRVCCSLMPFPVSPCLPWNKQIRARCKTRMVRRVFWMKHAEHGAAIASESAFTQRRGRDSSTRRAGAVLPPHFSPRGNSRAASRQKFPTVFGRCNEDLESSISFDCIQDNELKTSQVKG